MKAPCPRLFICLLALSSLSARGQALATASAPTSQTSPIMGLNFDVDYLAEHNSVTGWSQIISPTLSWRFNRCLSVSASVPWYASVNAFVPVRSGGVLTYPLESGKNLLGDATTTGQFEVEHNDFTYLLTTTVSFDTGNARYGLSARTTTYNFTNHFDYSIGPFTPDIEIGEGSNSTISASGVRRIYTAVGPLANFQAGTAIDLPRRLSLDLEAYEELPIGNQNVYGTITRKNKNGKTVTRQVLQGTGAAEDNGFTAELDVPIGRFLTLNGSYARSLIQGLDTTSFGITWTARAPKLQKIE